MDNDIKEGLSNGWRNVKSWWSSEVAPKLTLSLGRAV